MKALHDRSEVKLMPRLENETITRAKVILAGASATPNELQVLAKRLQKEGVIGLARRLLERGYQDPSVRQQPTLREEFAKRLALCTYKDPDLPVDATLDAALAI